MEMKEAMEEYEALLKEVKELENIYSGRIKEVLKLCRIAISDLYEKVDNLEYGNWDYGPE